MKAITGVANMACFGFFASHILATLIVDVQAVLPADWIPPFASQLLSDYLTMSKDPLMGNAQNLLWFQSLVCLELLIQLPFFFWICYMLMQKTARYPESFRYACIAYGGHACTSMVPILLTLGTNEEATITERAMLLSVYLPYLLFPLGLLIYAVSEDSASTPGTRKKSV